MKQQIERLLNGQATPEEEQQIARLLREGEDVEQWLAEDETAEYDRIVNQRKAKRSYLRWAVAAVIIAFVMVGTFVLWPKETDKVGTVNNVDVVAKVNNPTTPAIPTVTPAKPQPSPRATDHKNRSVKTAVSTVDSLQYYIARLEKELENVNESTYAAKAEEVLRADAQLQRLVQRIMIGEMTKDDGQAEALNTNKTKEEEL